MRRPTVRVVTDFFDPDELFVHTRSESHRAASFGVPFLGAPEAPWPVWLDALRRKIEGEVAHPITNCLARRSHGASWHWESYDALAPRSRIAVAIADGTSLRFRLASAHDRIVEHAVPPGALLVMDAKTQEHWQYRVGSADPGDRYWLTFRYALTTR